MENRFKVIGMELFEKFVAGMPEIEANRRAVEEMINRLAKQHADICEKYGESKSLNTIYAIELGKYYSSFSSISKDEIKEWFITRTNLLKNGKEKDTCQAIIYPTFANNKHISGAIAHTPTSTVFIIGDKVSPIKIGEEIILSNLESATQFLEEIEKASLEIAKHFLKNIHDSSDYLEYAADVIYRNLVITNTSAVKNEILREIGI